MSIVNQATRKLVAIRAANRCEYCRLHEDDMFVSFQIDHVIAQKHGGGNEIDNLAFTCPHCNQHKGSDLTTFIGRYDNIVLLFNPRKDRWDAHFETIEGEILPLSEVGIATIKLLQLNNVDLIILRKILSQIGRYP